jgi:hypothetical protein
MEALEIPSDFTSIHDAPPIILNVFDKDEGFLDADDYLGRAEISLEDPNTMYVEADRGNEIPDPTWHPIKFGIGDDAPSCRVRALACVLRLSRIIWGGTIHTRSLPELR